MNPDYDTRWLRELRLIYKFNKKESKQMKKIRKQSLVNKHINTCKAHNQQNIKKLRYINRQH